MTYTTHSADETQAIAKKISSNLTGGAVILLSGDLGAGKTTFVQGFAEAFGITDPVRSPTFIIRQDFAVKNNSAIARLVHIDLYRLNESSDLSTIDLDEVLTDPNTVTLVEWPERAGDYPWPPHIRIAFAHGAEPTTRTITVTSPALDRVTKS